MPMDSDLDIYRSANVLIRQHGDDAALEAIMRAMPATNALRLPISCGWDGNDQKGSL